MNDRLMRSMMQNFGMGMPFGSMFPEFDQSQTGFPPLLNNHHMVDPMNSMMMHGGGGGGGFMGDPMSMMMMMMNNPFQNIQQTMSMPSNGNGNNFSYCSSSVTSYTTDEHGRQQVYQQSNEVKQGPDGLKETKSAVRDSRSGHQELAIGHHFKEKAYIKKKSKNAYTGEEEQCEDLVGINEDEVETFEQDWQTKARNATRYSNQIQYNHNDRPSSSNRHSRLALTSSACEDGAHGSSYNQPSPKSHRPTISSLIDKVAMKAKKKKRNKEAKA